MCPSRTPRPRTSSSVLTNRGCWLRWAGFFTPRSASSPGRHSGENTQRVKATRQGSLQRCYLKSPLSQIYTPSVVRCLFFFLHLSLTLSPGLISTLICRTNSKILQRLLLFLTESRCTGRRERWPQSTCRQVASLTRRARQERLKCFVLE